MPHLEAVEVANMEGLSKLCSNLRYLCYRMPEHSPKPVPPLPRLRWLRVVLPRQAKWDDRLVRASAHPELTYIRIDGRGDGHGKVGPRVFDSRSLCDKKLKTLRTLAITNVFTIFGFDDLLRQSEHLENLHLHGIRHICLRDEKKVELKKLVRLGMSFVPCNVGDCRFVERLVLPPTAKVVIIKDINLDATAKNRAEKILFKASPGLLKIPLAPYTDPSLAVGSVHRETISRPWLESKIRKLKRKRQRHITLAERAPKRTRRNGR